ncbi:MAG: WYL domain-containing protein [Deltaproteobacteria bacterium]|nr:WYL domain-containing protein [Deltaproteobacteria bacterium]MBW2074899.1 WYL domain-containing protein [Deltaproteobacteria bacterium]RLB81289.1 MAG: hypothetical protein DRH17_09535 [Deltaproteobacteria bacterium]
MQSHRLARLLRVIVEVKTRPDKSPEQIAKDLGISIRQFYYDRNKLAQMGFRFSRAKGRFTILSDPVVTIGSLPLSEVLALVLATRHLFATRDFSIVRRALKGLYKIVDHMPDSQKQLLRSLIQDVIIKDGFGCNPDILEDIVRAVDEKRRILVHFRHGAPESRVALDPFKLYFKRSKLFLDAYAVERKKHARYRVETIDKIVFTPFYRPEYSHT